MPPLTELKLINHYGNLVNIKNNQTIENINVVKWNRKELLRRNTMFQEDVVRPMYNKEKNKQDVLSTYTSNNFMALQHPHIQVQLRDLWFRNR